MKLADYLLTFTILPFLEVHTVIHYHRSHAEIEKGVHVHAEKLLSNCFIQLPLSTRNFASEREKKKLIYIRCIHTSEMNSIPAELFFIFRFNFIHIPWHFISVTRPRFSPSLLHCQITLCERILCNLHYQWKKGGEE